MANAINQFRMVSAIRRIARGTTPPSPRCVSGTPCYLCIINLLKQIVKILSLTPTPLYIGSTPLWSPVPPCCKKYFLLYIYAIG